MALNRRGSTWQGFARAKEAKTITINRMVMISVTFNLLSFAMVGRRYQLAKLWPYTFAVSVLKSLIENTKCQLDIKNFVPATTE